MQAPDVEARGSSPTPVPVVICSDIFALVDQGRTKALDYSILEQMVREQASKCPGGLGCLVIIPSTASPPPDDVRRAINNVLGRLGPKLRCLCWLVEGVGFRAAAVRAALAGLRLLNRPAYPTLVAADMGDALRWMMPHLDDGVRRSAEIPRIMESIARDRSSLQPRPFAA
jgi:hypothetical protein